MKNLQNKPGKPGPIAAKPITPRTWKIIIGSK